ncbi:TetR family transcriptional regulator [Xenorhabdus mauleonii]|uniref:TetR family transcriptional regulator n=1 Tax=Xenorhabdus mauleonii TaxID=351675 RepID=A0A1I3PM83_9GAMM|nr:TetR/AcrR family transcriptional regulator [Xenorhabdus mauleonii]PHM44757.1 TetR family transcriptional regulator [Xenorhabdus mauleonii]SFJ22479.1 transcriptional regulator, TetR family [Xenorhabdus mauleonii]
MSKNISTARERILQVSHDLFYQEGIRATGIDRIIKEANVTKVTFYRHFPSKNDLIMAFLEYRHQRWINWFSTTLAAEISVYGTLVKALPAVLGKWFINPEFRGCAFINSTVEFSQALPEIQRVVQSHKQEMTEILAGYLPATSEKSVLAKQITLLIEGAIVMAQYGEESDQVVSLLEKWLSLHPEILGK